MNPHSVGSSSHQLRFTVSGCAQRRLLLPLLCGDLSIYTSPDPSFFAHSPSTSKSEYQTIVPRTLLAQSRNMPGSNQLQTCMYRGLLVDILANRSTVHVHVSPPPQSTHFFVLLLHSRQHGPVLPSPQCRSEFLPGRDPECS